MVPKLMTWSIPQTFRPAREAWLMVMTSGEGVIPSQTPLQGLSGKISKTSFVGVQIEMKYQRNQGVA
jgi:hypothetical protein